MANERERQSLPLGDRLPNLNRGPTIEIDISYEFTQDDSSDRSTVVCAVEKDRCATRNHQVGRGHRRVGVAGHEAAVGGANLIIDRIAQRAAGELEDPFRYPQVDLVT